MPDDRGALTEAGVRAYVDEHCFTGAPGERVGVELERLTVELRDPASPLSFGRVSDAVEAAGPLSGGSAITYEPGGQIELSGPPRADAAAACDAVSDDLLTVDAALRDAGLGVVALGYDPLRPPRLIHPKPRYAAMRRYFGADAPDGHVMMCSTASVQINLDLGPPQELARRWRLVHALGPALAAAFANSPCVGGRYAGLRSARAAVWTALDPTRTRPAAHTGQPGEDWAAYALDARVMFIFDGATGEHLPVSPSLTFREWVGRGCFGRHPTVADLVIHLTTLFPPVRPRGWLELRTVDTLPSPWWRVPVVVAAALVLHPEAAADAERLSTALTWGGAANGTADPRYARAARALLAAAAECAPAVAPDGAELIAEYSERWTARGRCPADDRLDAWRGGAPLLDPDADLLGAG